MKLFSTEKLKRGVMCTPAWIAIIRRVHLGYLSSFSIRIIVPWYKNDWHHDIQTRSHKWCRQYPEIFFFGPGFIGKRWFFGWCRAEDLGM